MGLFTHKLKGVLVLMYVCEFRTVEPDPYFILSASVSSARAVTGS